MDTYKLCGCYTLTGIGQIVHVRTVNAMTTYQYLGSYWWTINIFITFISLKIYTDL